MSRPAPQRAPRRIVVVGAGIAGLASAALLAADGHQVTLLERSEQLGGRAGRWEQDGFVFDTGPSWWLMPECFEHFFGLLGERLEDHVELVRLDPGYRVLGQRYAHPLDLGGGREASIAAFEREEPGAGAALEAYLRSAREAYELATGSFLSTTFSRVSGRTLRAVLPRAGALVRLLRESLHDRAARTVADTRLRQVLGYPAVFLGATPRTAPSLYHLMSAMDLGDGVRYPMGGFARLVEVLRDLAIARGVRMRTGVEVTAIRTAPRRALPGGRRSRVTGVLLAPAGAADDPGPATEHLAADLVVSAADLHHTETALLPAEARSYPQRWWDGRTSGPGAVLALLGVRGTLPSLAHHTLMFTEDWDLNFAQILEGPPQAPDPASIYVCRPSATDPGTAPPGHENLFVLIPVSPDALDGSSVGGGGRDGSGDADVEAAVDRAIAQISSWAGEEDLASRIVLRRTIGPADFARDLHSWRGNALGPAHTLRQSAFLRGSQRSRRVDGLLYAGGTTAPGVGVPMCLISAENVLKLVRGDRSDAPLPEVPLPGAEEPEPRTSAPSTDRARPRPSPPAAHRRRARP
ncbi:phytoene desaturase family protein [Brachybacterium hainanense]|uniref:Phytoene desaturase family protein n=1 Tax=Brachybacterium hainanense TaxID=1541174 RepID=A0ABV6RBM5_9MICO